MEIIKAKCREQLSSVDLEFVATVLGHNKNEISVNELLQDTEMRDIMLDEQILLQVIYQYPECAHISDRLFYYIILRHVLQGFGIDHRAVTDYMAELLTIYMPKYLESSSINRLHPMAYLYEMLNMQDHDLYSFHAHSNVGSYTLFLTGVVPEEIRFKKRLHTCPKLEYFEAMGAKHYIKAGKLDEVNKERLSSVYKFIARNYRKLRLALNVMAEHHIFNRYFSMEMETGKKASQWL